MYTNNCLRQISNVCEKHSASTFSGSTSMHSLSISIENTSTVSTFPIDSNLFNSSLEMWTSISTNLYRYFTLCYVKLNRIKINTNSLFNNETENVFS